MKKNDAVGCGCFKAVVVDDDTAVRDITAILIEVVLEKILVERNIIIKTEESAIDAYKTLIQETHHLVITDYNMGKENKENGDELIKKIRKNEITQKIPVIGISGKISNKELMISAGADVFIAKPFGLTELSEALKKVLKI